MKALKSPPVDVAEHALAGRERGAAEAEQEGPAAEAAEGEGTTALPLTKSVLRAVRGAFETLFSTERRPESERRLRSGTAEKLMRSAAQRIQMLEVGRAWGAWVEMAERQHQRRKILQQLRQPELAKGWITWRTWYGARTAGRRLVRRALRGLTHGSLIRAFAQWAKAHGPAAPKQQAAVAPTPPVRALWLCVERCMAIPASAP
jgi:hypothetical protein